MRCPKCGEQWDLDSIHEEISYLYGDEVEELREKYKNDPRRHRYNDPFQAEYESKYFKPMKDEFYKNGCSTFGSRCNSVVNEEAAFASSALEELLGDDVDGIEAMLEDMGL